MGTGVLVDGLDFSDDKMLVGRTFSYSDTQRHRVGTNYLQLPVNQAKSATVATNLNGGQMSFQRDLAPGQNPHVNYEPSIHGGLEESKREQPSNGPEIRGQLTRSVIERRNDYVQARGRFCTMMDWERDDLIDNMATMLGDCERDVQERMIWHFLLVHDDYGKRVGDRIGVSADQVRNLPPLAKQVLTEEDQRRLANLGRNGDKIDPTVWGQWTSSVRNHQASADEVLNRTLDQYPMTEQAAE
jgi:catalase